MQHRLPLLYRLLFGPLSYFHPIKASSISVSGSGKWVTSLLQANIFKHHSESSSELRRLMKRVSTWLAGAHFCLQLDDIDALGQVALSTDFDIVTYMHIADVMAFRTTVNVEDENTAEAAVLNSTPRKQNRRRETDKPRPITQIVRLGGADVTGTIPSFLLPHHEHILPPRPTANDIENQSQEIDDPDGNPKAVQAEKELERLQRDETNITVSVHGSLPACFDQSLLNFTAALVKATKIIEIERNAELATEADDRAADVLSRSTTNTSMTPDDALSISSTEDGTHGSKLRGLTRQLKANLHASSNLTKDALKDFAKDVQTSTRENIKKAVVGSVVNDRWIAKMVGKVAAKLESAQGELGYTGAIPVGLEFYRNKFGDADASKLLP